MFLFFEFKPFDPEHEKAKKKNFVWEKCFGHDVAKSQTTLKN
jgi:hypothetical protein